MSDIRCPVCSSIDIKVIDTRGNNRRRECKICFSRWSTSEQLIQESIKKSNIQELDNLIKTVKKK